MAFKLEAIQYAEKVSNRDSSTKYKVDIKRIREWRKDKDAIEELKAKPKGKHRETLDIGGRKGFVERFDDLLHEWIYGRRAYNGLRVSHKLIKMKARQIYDDNCSEDEKELVSASAGWLDKFMQRNGLSLRRKTMHNRPARAE